MNSINAHNKMITTTASFDKIPEVVSLYFLFGSMMGVCISYFLQIFAMFYRNVPLLIVSRVLLGFFNALNRCIYSLLTLDVHIYVLVKEFLLENYCLGIAYVSVLDPFVLIIIIILRQNFCQVTLHMPCPFEVMFG